MQGCSDKMPIIVKCVYCGQMTKTQNCGYFKGASIHNKINCNCLQAAIKSNFFVAPSESKRWNNRRY